MSKDLILPKLPRDALSKVKLGVSFAEYDNVLSDPNVFVTTPAALAAADPTRQKYFFVGRRGTGKTATSLHVCAGDNHTRAITPAIFSTTTAEFELSQFQDPRQRPYRSLISAFLRAIQEEWISQWFDCCGANLNSVPQPLRATAERACDVDFDTRLLGHVNGLLMPLANKNDTLWLSEINEHKRIAKLIEETRYSTGARHTILFDRLDEFWDGSDVAVAYLTALMHAVLQLNTGFEKLRCLVFVRENVFERVRALDSEFARLETSVVGLDWTKEQLLELVERRLNRSLSAKLPLKGRTWDSFFESGEAARSLVFDYCQDRPRDVLIYCNFAIEAAIAHQHERISEQDLLDARRRFSDSRLKDVGDEYSENFPQIALVLSRFYGLGRRMTLGAVSGFLEQLLDDTDIKHLCASWIFRHSSPELFVRLLFNIGFVGMETTKGPIFRSTGPRDTTPPAISISSSIVIHPSYWDALDLQDATLGNVDGLSPYQRVGLLADLPDDINVSTYVERIGAIEQRLSALPMGHEGAAAFEEVVGDVIKYCFYRSLVNAEAKARTIDGRVIRDWVSSNRADSGFWEYVRTRYGAGQVIWECKNFSDLDSQVFQQVSYYLNQQVGRFGVLVFRGEVKPFHFEHIKRCAQEKDAMILLLNESDLRVFLRQSKNGKMKESHIQDRFDKTIRAIS